MFEDVKKPINCLGCPDVYRCDWMANECRRYDPDFQEKIAEPVRMPVATYIEYSAGWLDPATGQYELFAHPLTNDKHFLLKEQAEKLLNYKVKSQKELMERLGEEYQHSALDFVLLEREVTWYKPVKSITVDK